MAARITLALGCLCMAGNASAFVAHPPARWRPLPAACDHSAAAAAIRMMARSPSSGKPARGSKRSAAKPEKTKEEAWEETKKKRAAAIKALKSLATLYRGRKESNEKYLADVAAYEAQQRAQSQRANAPQEPATPRAPAASGTAGGGDGWVNPGDLVSTFGELAMARAELAVLRKRDEIETALKNKRDEITATVERLTGKS
jgi:hypothetical protein